MFFLTLLTGHSFAQSIPEIKLKILETQFQIDNLSEEIKVKNNLLETYLDTIKDYRSKLIDIELKNDGIYPIQAEMSEQTSLFKEPTIFSDRVYSPLKRGAMVELFDYEKTFLKARYKNNVGYINAERVKKTDEVIHFIELLKRRNEQNESNSLNQLIEINSNISTNSNQKGVSYISDVLNFQPQSSGEIIKHTYYTLAYSEEHEQPLWVQYKLTPSFIEGTTERTDDFRSDPMISTGSATLEDYKGSGYDRGHLCPAGDMKISNSAMSESFYLSNMSPQEPSFNRGIWKNLESTTRTWASVEKEIWVVTGGVFKNNKGSIGANKVTIPGYYYKVIFDTTDDPKMIGLVLPNEKGTKQLYEYVVSVDSIETLTGIDFFPQLPDVIENTLESKSEPDQWGFEEISSNSSGGTAIQCKGIAKSTGKRCKNKSNNENGYCYLHQDQAPGVVKKEIERMATSVQCSGKTQKGLRCKNKTKNANGYCYLHQSQASGSSSTTKSTSSYKYSGSRTIHTGPRGGKYYINSNGNKTYIKK